MTKDIKKVRCPKCYKLLCKRVPVHLGKDESYIVHIKFGKLELYTYDTTIKCPSCQQCVRVNGESGILAKEIHSNA